MRAPVRLIATLLLFAGALLPFGAAPSAAATEAPLQVTRPFYDVTGMTPRVCVGFEDRLDLALGLNAADYVAISPETRDLDIRVSDGQICLSGLDWGRSYDLTLRAGLEDRSGQTLPGDRTLAIEIPDAPASVGFSGTGYVLTRAGNADETVLPLTTMNVDSVEIEVLRVVDRNLITQLRGHQFDQALSGWSVDGLADWDGERVWKGTLDVQGTRNRAQRTGIAVDRILDRSVPGVHVVVAKPAGTEQPDWQNRATRWVVVSDLGVSTFQDDGLTLFVNGLTDARPRADVEVDLVARNNKVLASVATDDDGRVDFSAGLMRGDGGNTPTALMFYGPNGDFTTLSLTGPVLDLADRDVTGRAQPGPIDGFLWGDRDIYRPGETVHVAGLLRDTQARAMDNLPASLRFVRPDGRPYREIALRAQPDGAYETSLDLARSAPTGRWQAELRVDPDADPVATLAFAVEDFVPERLDLSLTAPEAADPGASLSVAVQSDYLFGAPAGDLKVTGELVIERDDAPFPDHKAYRFGLVTDDWITTRTELAETRTDAGGNGILTATLPTPSDTTLPLKATVRGTVLEPGGRGVTRSTEIRLRPTRPAIGLRPLFQEDRVAQGTEAAVDVLALAPDGSPIAGESLHWTLVREIRDYRWFRTDAGWDYTVTVTDRDAASGQVTTGAEPVRVAAPVDWGSYRLEVYDGATGAASSVRFYAGWRAGPSAGNTPDTVRLALDKEGYRPDETASLFIEPPYPGEALVTVLGDGVERAMRVSVPAEGTEISFDVGEDWGAAGAYVAVTLLRPGGEEADRAAGQSIADQPANGPRTADRALGLAWLTLDTADRTLEVGIDAPEAVRPNTTLRLPVTVSGLAPGERAHLTLAAVDQGILSLTGYQTPDPAAHYYGKRRFETEIRDLYGRLIDGRWDRMGTLRAGGDAMARQTQGLDADSYDTVALFSGLVSTDADGQAVVELAIPDFNGALRLMAVAFSADKVGSAEATLTVRPPLVADLSRPRFLAPGDEAELALELLNLSAPEGAYTATLGTEGPVSVAGDAMRSVTLADGGKEVRRLRIRGTGTGVGAVTLRVDGPDDFALERRFDLAVRAPQAVETQLLAATVEPDQTLSLTSDVMQDIAAETAAISLALATQPNLDLPRLLAGLSRYPYGCLEQTVSTAMPLLYARDLADLAGDESWGLDPAGRVQSAIWRILDKQRGDGAFGLWSADDGAEDWLTAYALDFLGRARRAGLGVPDAAFESGLDWLEATQVDSPIEQTSYAARTYALYVLAREGRGDAGAARYLQDTQLQNLDAGEKAQLGAALALLGEPERAERLLQATGLPERTWSDVDYGSRLRDGALRLARMAEVETDPAAMIALGEQVAAAMAQDRWLNTQEMAWLTLAANALSRIDAPMAVTLDGAVLPRTLKPVTAALTPTDLDDGYPVLNRGRKPVFARISVTGVPTGPRPPEQNGFRIERRVHALDGRPVGPGEAFTSGARYLVILTGSSETELDQQAMAVDLLPAGFEIENTRLMNGGSLGDFDWVGELTRPAHTEFRDDRFVSALDLSDAEDSFRLAYLVRAVTPGAFVWPAPYVEDMYRPERFARGPMSRLQVSR